MLIGFFFFLLLQAKFSAEGWDQQILQSLSRTTWWFGHYVTPNFFNLCQTKPKRGSPYSICYDAVYQWQGNVKDGRIFWQVLFSVVMKLFVR